MIRATASRAFVAKGRVYARHLQPTSKSPAKFQLILRRQGTEQTTDLPFTVNGIERLGVEALAQV